MNASDFALKIAAFIKHNNISTEDYTMAEIVEGYMAAQAKMYDSIEQELIETL